MRTTVLLLVLTVLMGATAGCLRFRALRTPHPAAPAEPLAPSPRLIVGRIIAVDPERPFAFVALGADAPPAATAEGTELSSRSPELRHTAHLRASRYVRGRTLGVTIVEGRPSPGDEVVWLAP
ncbi:MAG: hypothetical protein HZC55_12115 [Verrucomicrobia bacterium]|nr:hypothetical protein [Verrucomicrobiota bacterium]